MKSFELGKQTGLTNPVYSIGSIIRTAISKKATPSTYFGCLVILVILTSWTKSSSSSSLELKSTSPNLSLQLKKSCIKIVQHLLVQSRESLRQRCSTKWPQAVFCLEMLFRMPTEHFSKHIYKKYTHYCRFYIDFWSKMCPLRLFLANICS